ncbi:MAG: hypothetical protein ABIG89_02625 [Candidatus Woesearchaeota archaeon]
MRKGKQFQANPKLIKEIINNMGKNTKLTNSFKQALEYFYLTLSDYTQKVYLNLDIFLSITEKNEKKATDLDIGFVLQLPFFLSFAESKDQKLYEIIVQMLSLDDYVRLIQRFELQNYHLLDETKRVYDFIETFEKIEKIFPKLENKEIPLFSKNIKAMKTLGGK